MSKIMKQPKNSYSRKISLDEAKKGYFFVLKDDLSFFPAVGKGFVIESEGISHDAAVESYSCTCQGPRKPHYHYFIRWKGLKVRDRVRIDFDGEKYLLNMHV